MCFLLVSFRWRGNPGQAAVRVGQEPALRLIPFHARWCSGLTLFFSTSCIDAGGLCGHACIRPSRVIRRGKQALFLFLPSAKWHRRNPPWPVTLQLAARTSFHYYRFVTVSQLLSLTNSSLPALNGCPEYCDQRTLLPCSSRPVLVGREQERGFIIR